MRNTILMSTLVALALMALACGGEDEPSLGVKGALDGTLWTLTTLNGQTALKEAVVTINFAAGQCAGSDGCNRYSGSYTADAATIRFDELFTSTMMACSEPISNQATAYLKALGQAAAYMADDRKMSLYDNDGREVAAFSAQSSELTGTSWIVTAFNNGRQAVVGVMAGIEITADFGADGKVGGSGGCNSYMSPYQSDGSKITVGPVVLSTRKACEQAVMDEETQYLAALTMAAAYRIEGSKLELRDAGGALAVTLKSTGP